MKETFLTVAGVVVTKPRAVVLDGSLPVTSFRLASTSRRFDRQSRDWVDGHTSWLTVTCWRQLAKNALASIVVKDRVIVHGRLRTPEWEGQGGAKRSGVELEAESLGHDLMFGTSQFTRIRRAEPVETPERRAALELAREGDLESMGIADLGTFLDPADEDENPERQLEDAEQEEGAFEPDLVAR